MSDTGAPDDESSPETSPSTPERGDEQGVGRHDQHGPEMDDTQVEATGELADAFEPARPAKPVDSAGEQDPS